VQEKYRYEIHTNLPENEPSFNKGETKGNNIVPVIDEQGYRAASTACEPRIPAL
jgi:hypothetical protein